MNDFAGALPPPPRRQVTLGGQVRMHPHAGGWLVGESSFSYVWD